MSSNTEESLSANALKVRCHNCDHRIIVENPEPLAMCQCPDCNASFIIPKQIGQCLFESSIHEDELIATYRGTDLKLNRQVMFNLIKKEFINEDEIYNIGIGTFTHDNAATIFGTQEVDGDLIVLSEYINGHTLHYLHETKQLDIPAVSKIAENLINVMTSASESDVHHGHLCLNSIWLSNEGEVKVSDFMIRQKVRENCVQNITAKILDSDYFKDPFASGCHEATDLYSLGVCLYKLTTGKIPFGTFEEPQSLNKEIPAKLNSLIIGLLKEEFSSFAAAKQFFENSKEFNKKQKSQEETKTKSIVLKAPLETSPKSSEVRPKAPRSNYRVKALKKQLLISRVILCFFTFSSLVLAMARYSPSSSLGQKSEQLLKSTLDKVFPVETNELDMDEILNNK